MDKFDIDLLEWNSSSKWPNCPRSPPGNSSPCSSKRKAKRGENIPFFPCSPKSMWSNPSTSANMKKSAFRPGASAWAAKGELTPPPKNTPFSRRSPGKSTLSGIKGFHLAQGKYSTPLKLPRRGKNKIPTRGPCKG